MTDEPKRCAHDGCKLLAEGGSDLCILHQPTPKDVERFKTALYAQLDEQGPEDERNSRSWFEGYVFPRAVVAGTRDERSHFHIALPLGMDCANFRGATFQSGADFAGAKFEGSADFNGSSFEEGACFTSAEFPGVANFGGAAFSKGALFRLVHFDWIADFSRARFEGGADFTGGEFKEDVSFCGAKFAEGAYFHGRRFAGTTNFNGASFAGAAYFVDAVFKGRVSFFSTAVWFLFLGWEKPHIWGWGHARCGVSLEHYSSAPLFWRFAQRAFSSTGDREKADAAFYFARLAERKAQRAVNWPSREGIRWCGWVPWLMKCVLRIILKAWPTLVWVVECVFVRWTTAYGASLARLFITWAFVVGSFGAAYSLAPSLIGNGPNIWSLRNWVVGLHFSVTTFTTLGLGALGSDRLVARVLISVEAILGAVLVALAVLVIGRRYMRQS